MVLTNAAAGTDEEFNRWYNGQHIDDLLRVPGVLSAQRFKTTSRQMVNVNGALAMVDRTDQNAPHQYMAIYNIESDDIEATLMDILNRAGTPDMIISETLWMGPGSPPAGPQTLCFEALAPLRKR
jgi:hypothetical protein